MRRHDLEVFGSELPDLLAFSDVVFDAMFADRYAKDLNDGVRTGASSELALDANWDRWADDVYDEDETADVRLY